MLRQGMSVLEATQEWVRGFNAIDQEIIRRLMENEPEAWREITIKNPEDADTYYDLPIWGTMWSFDDGIDTWWLEEDCGIEKMSECGFRIFKHEEFGYFFGIDGAGYDFYEDHWIPLYRARGMQWHDDNRSVA